MDWRLRNARSSLCPGAPRLRKKKPEKIHTAGETTMRVHLVAAATCGLLLLSNGAQAAEVKVLASGAVKEAALERFPQFEKTSGHKVAVTWAGTVDIKKKVA